MKLNVFLFNTLAGYLFSTADRGVVFVYDENYVNNNGMPLSLPLQKEEFSQKNVCHIFLVFYQKVRLETEFLNICIFLNDDDFANQNPTEQPKDETTDKKESEKEELPPVEEGDEETQEEIGNLENCNKK